MAARTDFDSDDLGPQLLAVKTGARGSLGHLAMLLGVPHRAADAAGRSLWIARGWQQGRTMADLFATAATSREALGKTAQQCAEEGYNIRQARITKGFGVLARAMRSHHPGIVFARAAAIGEADQLADLDSRLYVGLRPED